MDVLDWTVLLVFLCVLYYVYQRVHKDLLIRRTGGVRAPVLATNPVTGARFFLDAAWKQANNRLLEYYDGVYRWATPASPNCVEISVVGKIRFIMTREPEHVKTVLTSKFAEYGKGPQFHEVWSPFLGDSILTTDGRLWQESRGLIRPMFVKDRVRDLDIFERWADKLISKLPSSGKTVDMCDLFYRMTLDVTTDFLLGGSVNSLDK